MNADFLMQFLAGLLDKSKAKNPMVWFILACVIAAVQAVIVNAAEWQIPLSAGVAQVLQWVITVGGLLLGSRTTQILKSANNDNS